MKTKLKLKSQLMIQKMILFKLSILNQRNWREVTDQIIGTWIDSQDSETGNS